jgi:hypothetical protein
MESAMEKQPSLLQTLVNNGQKKFYNIAPGLRHSLPRSICVRSQDQSLNLFLY